MNIKIIVFYTAFVMLILTLITKYAEYLESFIPNFKEHQIRFFMIHGISLLWSIIAPYFNLPVVLYLAIYYLLLRASFMKLELSSFKRELIMITSFLFYAAFLLIITGVCAVITGQDIMQYFSHKVNRMTVVFLLQIAALLIPNLLRKCIDTSLFNELQDVRKSNSLLLFLWCCFVFVMFDALFCRLDLIGNVVSLLLISGNSLLLVLVYWLIKHDLDLVKQFGREREKQQLSVLQAQKQLKVLELQQSIDIEPLTNAYSRRYIMRLLENWRSEQREYCVVFIDMDNLKKVNDEMGHSQGDALLIEFTRSLKQQLSSDALMARLSGDEFLIVLPNRKFIDCQVLMETIRKSLQKQVQPWPLEFSYGIAEVKKEDAAVIEEIIQRADQAMYQDKKSRKRAGDVHE